MTAQEALSTVTPDYALRLLAEECCELGKAALKVVRVLNDETPMSMGEARENLIEETGDVLAMMTVLRATFHTVVEAYDIERGMEYKLDRFVDRIEEKLAKQDPAQ